MKQTQRNPSLSFLSFFFNLKLVLQFYALFIWKYCNCCLFQQNYQSVCMVLFAALGKKRKHKSKLMPHGFFASKWLEIFFCILLAQVTVSLFDSWNPLPRNLTERFVESFCLSNSGLWNVWQWKNQSSVILGMCFISCKPAYLLFFFPRQLLDIKSLSWNFVLVAVYIQF